MRARGSSRTGALPPPLGQLTTGDPARLQRHLTATAGTAAGGKDSVYTTELISFHFNAFLCICCMIYSVYAVLKLIEKHIFTFK